MTSLITIIANFAEFVCSYLPTSCNDQRGLFNEASFISEINTQNKLAPTPIKVWICKNMQLAMHEFYLEDITWVEYQKFSRKSKDKNECAAWFFSFRSKLDGLVLCIKRITNWLNRFMWPSLIRRMVVCKKCFCDRTHEIVVFSLR